MNDGGCKSPELLAKYCDVLLKKGKSTLEEKQLEDKLAQIVRRKEGHERGEEEEDEGEYLCI
jgi:hypothetical protein